MELSSSKIKKNSYTLQPQPQNFSLKIISYILSRKNMNLITLIYSS